MILLVVPFLFLTTCPDLNFFPLLVHLPFFVMGLSEMAAFHFSRFSPKLMVSRTGNGGSREITFLPFQQPNFFRFSFPRNRLIAPAPSFVWKKTL